MTEPRPVLILVVCAAPPAAKIQELAELLTSTGWDVYPVLTEAAIAWVDQDALEKSTRHAVKSQPRSPQEPKSLPRADAILVAPATFNTINQWAVGINDTVVLGILNEALGTGTRVVVSPYAKSALAAHPAFRSNLDMLAGAGVRFTAAEALRPADSDAPFNWSCILELLNGISVTARTAADSHASEDGRGGGT
ncbi:flavoprotein [Catellatospora sp. KI3]|uniref:flavoprotein n=1 Tax=Catellatospora sp. KI3 TaxID=3041620 RepID=UPI002482F4C0|nr:flavoprotein [Catellatospora sp. KI3]MDI1461062.1 flavoprotein [Catellatospora sp. KI3]